MIWNIYYWLKLRIFNFTPRNILYQEKIMTTGASPVDLSCQKRDLCNNQSIMSPDPSHLKKKGGGYKDVTSSGSCDIAPESPRSKCPGSTGFS